MSTNKLPTRRTKGRFNKQYTAEDKQKIVKRLENATSMKWKPFILGYFCSENGHLWNEDTKQYETPVKLEHDYKQYTLCFNGKRNGRLLHRIVGYCFDESVTPQMFNDKDNWKAHHLSFDRTQNHYTNICYLPYCLHKALHSDVRKGLVKLEDVNTKDKIYRYFLNRPEPVGILNDIDFDMDANVWIDIEEIYPENELKDYIAWCNDNGYNCNLLSSTIVYALVTEKAS